MQRGPDRLSKISQVKRVTEVVVFPYRDDRDDYRPNNNKENELAVQQSITVIKSLYIIESKYRDARCGFVVLKKDCIMV